jgi:hypothetical protein
MKNLNPQVVISHISQQKRREIWGTLFAGLLTVLDETLPSFASTMARTPG